MAFPAHSAEILRQSHATPADQRHNFLLASCRCSNQAQMRFTGPVRAAQQIELLVVGLIKPSTNMFKRLTSCGGQPSPPLSHISANCNDAYFHKLACQSKPWRSLVEAAGVEPASGNIPYRHLHT